MFPQVISTLAWDITERLFFAASADGTIYQMNLFREREAIGGGGVSDVIRAGDETRKERSINVGYVGALFHRKFRARVQS